MPSPFPGMNPYLEQPGLWRGVHGSFLVFLRSALIPAVGTRYFVDLDESLYIDDADDRRLFAVADLGVTEVEPAADAGGGTAVAAAPVTLRIPIPRSRRSRRLVIQDIESREVVTVVELLSPSNKRPGRDRDRYLDKRHQVLASDANFVEIDLLRGDRLPLDDPPACDYYALVSRPADRPRVGFWPVRLRDELPTIPVPLRPGEPEPTVSLQPVLHRVYDEGGYTNRAYRGEPDPPLSADDAEWARAVLAGG